MRLEAVARLDIPTISPIVSIEECARLMRDSGHRLLPVVEGAQLRGIISLSDIVFRSIAEGSDWFLARTRDFMTCDVICCETSMTGSEALDRFDRAGQIKLPLVDRESIYRGMLHRSDLFMRIDAEALNSKELLSLTKSRVEQPLRLVPRKTSH